MRSKPSGCIGCPLYESGQGFVPPIGPVDAPVLLLAEAPGEEEAQRGEPLVGKIGNWTMRQLSRLGYTRQQFRIHNTIACRPPGNKLAGMPYEQAAIDHCAQYREEVLEERHKVIFTMGVIASRALLHTKKGFDIEAFHACPFPTRYGIVVPTYHPGFITKGNFKYTPMWLFDLSRAMEIAEEGLPQDEPSLVLDPPPLWLDRWADAITEDTHLIADIETPYSLTEEPDETDPSYQIQRISFSYNPNEGVSVPFSTQYLPVIQKIFTKARYVWFWNWRYDVPRLKWNGIRIEGMTLEGMDAWGTLQSDLASSDDDMSKGKRGKKSKGTRTLAFVAPFYSTYGPWKHLADEQPAKYSALDAVQTARVVYGMIQDMVSLNLWEPFWRHRVLMDHKVLLPAERKGVLIDKQELEKLKLRLIEAKTRLLEEIEREANMPTYVIKQRVKDPAGYVQKQVDAETLVCETCGKPDLTIKHKCKSGEAKLVKKVAPVVRFVKEVPFNPGSVPQLLKYIEKDQMSKLNQSWAIDTTKTELEELLKKTGNQFYRKLLDYRAITKVLSTYVLSTEERIKRDGRLHPKFGHKPSTWRLNSWDPNLQNIDSKEEDEENPRPEQGFKRVIVAGKGKLLVEADFSGIEAVLSGYFMGDPVYMRLATMGVHSYLTSHKIGWPADLDWPDDKLRAYLASMKKQAVYKNCKKTVHLSNYAGTPYVMNRTAPDAFPTVESARQLQNLYFSICPKLPKWWHRLWAQAHKQNYLGGADHPYGYIHRFFEIYEYNHRTGTSKPGHDAKRAVAYYPQSTAYGKLAEACLELMDEESEFYVGDFDEGETPILALIHDSILGEVPEAVVDEYCARVYAVMTRPTPQLNGLVIGVDIKVGKNWGEMEKWNGPAGNA